MTLSLAHDPRTCSRSQWKSSTASSHKERTTFHVTPEFGKQAISSFSRADLQNFLDLKARKRLWYSDVSHLRRDLKQMFELADSGAAGRIVCCSESLEGTYGLASSGARMPNITLVRASMLSARASIRRSPSPAAELACSVR